MKPRILISGTMGKMDNYIRAVEAAGGIAVARYAPMPEQKKGIITAEDAHGYDGLILCGGGDISPAMYSGQDAGLCRGIDPIREESDRCMCKAFWRAKKPVLGICRGMQMINVLFGGTLLEDLGELNEIHKGNQEGDRYHLVSAQEGSLLHQLYGGRFPVNSSHHQAVERPGEVFCVTCQAEDGTIEAIESPTLPILGVQWHPERHKLGGAVFTHFVNMCKKGPLV